MSNVTQILHQIESGDSTAASELLPIVYNELRALARNKLSLERPGHTLQATALVHEAFIRLVDCSTAQHWKSRGHFFASAAEAMRRILVDQARHRKALKSGGQWQRIELNDHGINLTVAPEDLLALEEALEKLEQEDAQAAEIARLRLFTGMTIEEVSTAIDAPQTTVFRNWTYARAFLKRELDP